MPIDALEFSEALRIGLLKSGLIDNERLAQANCLPLAMAVANYFNSRIESSSGPKENGAVLTA